MNDFYPFHRCFERQIMSTLADLTALVSKVNADIDTKLGALNKQIADLQAQLAGFQNDQAAIDQAVTDLTAADAKLA